MMKRQTDEQRNILFGVGVCLLIILLAITQLTGCAWFSANKETVCRTAQDLASAAETLCGVLSDTTLTETERAEAIKEYQLQRYIFEYDISVDAVKEKVKR